LRYGLDDLVTGRVESPPIVTIYDVELAFLTTQKKQMLRRAERLIQQQSAARAQIHVLTVQCGLIEGSEIIGDREHAGGGRPHLDDTGTIVSVAHVESTVPGGKEYGVAIPGRS